MLVMFVWQSNGKKRNSVTSNYFIISENNDQPVYKKLQESCLKLFFIVDFDQNIEASGSTITPSWPMQQKTERHSGVSQSADSESDQFQFSTQWRV